MDEDRPPFSMLVAFRDTPQERRFAERSLPAAVSLEPDELVVGVDAPASDSLVSYIRSICKPYDAVRIVAVPKSDAWGFQQAHVHWRCYRECRHDRILLFDVDLVLRDIVLGGLDMIGVDNTACVSYTKRALTKTIPDYMRYACQRAMMLRSTAGFSGLHWVYRPYYFEDVDRAELERIRNGVDTYLYGCVRRAGRRVVTRKSIGADCLDYANRDHPWRQFHDGIWYGSNHTLRFLLRVGAVAAMYHHPWIIRGYWWARRNNESDAFRAARSMTYDEWCTVGAAYVREIREWGETGTGYG